MSDAPYFVEVDNNGCPHCSGGRTYTVIGPDGYGLGQSWGGDDGEDAAQDMADLLNSAYAAGKAAVNCLRFEAVQNTTEEEHG